jgi:histidinol dehydrogenase
MKISKYPSPDTWEQLAKRPTLNNAKLTRQVKSIIRAVRERGDEALLEYERQFDCSTLSALEVSHAEWENVKIRNPLREAIKLAVFNIRKYHESQEGGLGDRMCADVSLYQRAIPIEKVGLYVPGGTAPLISTVLMLAIPAQVAGCKEIVLCTPPGKQGNIHPAILHAAKIAGVTRIFKLGGAQAIAAMAYGTETVPQVYKIFGPGNQYVTAAKGLVSLDAVAIDMPAGPSEVLVVADDTANPIFVAADLLSQAEHGADSQAILVTTSPELLENVQKEIKRQLKTLPRAELAAKSLSHSKLILVNSLDEAMAFSNLYAPEHLIIESDEYADLRFKVVNAGSVFLGHWTPESFGDYASGANHTLPTNGYARMYSGLNVDSYKRKITFQRTCYNMGFRRVGKAACQLAKAENLEAHSRAVELRLQVMKEQGIRIQ